MTFTMSEPTTLSNYLMIKGSQSRIKWLVDNPKRARSTLHEMYWKSITVFYW